MHNNYNTENTVPFMLLWRKSGGFSFEDNENDC